MAYNMYVVKTFNTLTAPYQRIVTFPKEDMNYNGNERRDEDSSLNRRTYLKLAGSAAVPAAVAGAASGTAAASESGFGTGGYGLGGYGSSGGAEPTTNAAPSVDEVLISESSPPNPHAEVTAFWAVSDEDEDLNTVVVSVYDESRRVDSETISVRGATASGSNDFCIKKGAEQTFDVVVSVVDSRGEECSKTGTVSA